MDLTSILAGHQKPRAITGVRSPLHVRALAFDDGSERYVLLSYDLLWLGSETCRSLRQTVAVMAGMKMENVVVTCTHTHSSPDSIGMYQHQPPPAGHWLASLVSCGVKTASAALADISACECESVQTNLGLGISRRLRFLGRTWRFPNPCEDINDTFTVMRFFRPGGLQIGGIMHAAIHPVYAPRSSTQLSADFPGALSGEFEREEGGTWLFLQGASGDVTPKSLWRGYRAMARAAKGAYERVKRIAPDRWRTMPLRVRAMTREVEVGSKPHSYLEHLRTAALGKDGQLNVEITAWIIGCYITVILPGEVLSSTERAIVGGKRSSVIFIGMGNGYYGYFPPSPAFSDGGYEVRACMLSPRGMDTLVRVAGEMISSLPEQ